MARPLRVQRPGGRYHVTARGNERKAIFRDDTDRYHFLELLGELGERFGANVHAFVLMENHFHLLLETLEANLSKTMQWLVLSYSMWFNRRHHRVGHLFQARFGAVIVEEDAGWQEVARYVHLNPVRLAALELSKRQRMASRAGAMIRPRPEVIAERLRILRGFRWSSYRGYAGYCSPLHWVCRDPVARLCGGRSAEQQRAALRQYTEQAIRQGVVERPWDHLKAGLVLGTEAFAAQLLLGVRGNAREQPGLKQLNKPAGWAQIVRELERVRGDRWEQFSRAHGDWGRDAALWLGRRHGRLTLAQLGALSGGMDYAAVGQAVSRFGKKLRCEAKLQLIVNEVRSNLSIVET